MRLTDSATYVDFNWSTTVRPWLTPAFFAVFGTGAVAAIMLCTIAAAGWTALAFGCAKAIDTARPAVITAVFLIATAPLITQWNSALLSESLGISGLALLIGATLALGSERPTHAIAWFSAASVGALLCVGSRQSLVIFVGCFGYGWYRARRHASGQGGQIVWAIGLIGSAVVLGTVGQTTAASERPYTQSMVMRLTPPGGHPPTAKNLRLANVVYRDIMPNDEYRSELVARGMPDGPKAVGDFGGMRAFASQEMVAWLDEYGSYEYARWALTHPETSLGALRDYSKQLASADQTLHTISSVKPARWSDAVIPRTATALFVALVLAVGAMELSASLDTTRRRPRLVVAAIAALVAVHTVTVVLSDGSDPIRHNLPAAAVAAVLTCASIAELGGAVISMRRAPSPDRSRKEPAQATAP